MGMNCYLYSSPSGIELIEGDKMPVRLDHPCEAGIPGPGCPMCIGYEAAQQAAKASGIPVKDQERAKAMIKSHLKEKNPGLPAVMFEETVYGPFDISYELMEACGNDSCAMDAGCEHCQKPVKIAILLPESKLPEKEQRETFNMLFCQYFDLIKAGHSEHTTVTELMEHFTITRKQ